MDTNQTSLSILMFPWIAHGHIYPYLELAKNLSNHNFQIHYCSTLINLTSIKKTLATSPTLGVPLRLIELRLPATLDLPPELHTTKNAPPTLIPKLHEAFHRSRSNFYAIISSLKPDLLIYDCFQPWAASTASALGIPAVYFSVSSAATYSFHHHLYTVKNSPFPYDAMYLRGHEERAFKRTIVGKILEEDEQEHAFAFFKQSREIVLIKTSRILEGKYIDYLSLLCKRIQIPVGSLITSSSSTKDDDDDQTKMIMKWLSGKKRFSTVFISFGSENYLSNDQMREIAKGLEICGVNFIWVVRCPRGEAAAAVELPEGLLERGMIVEWAPQERILGHPSTGAFVSHCGWSSTLESIHFGVPVIGLPLKVDQPFNARLMVEVGVAVEVARDGDGNFGGGAFADAVNEVVGGKIGEGMRVRAKELSERMRREEEMLIGEAARQLRRICLESKRR
ncbi:beta-D-glucosyl crocetin beta-1,6-glucosyltransferase-like [Salvia miltiorrhiza]|uniref:beta-D-glucosyl crocetin beta-1,6-glucosyltransferase-like n=1 Tax=Salvia miltiorrhiza TaxID=226208 RepID=UPI0025AD00EC|nr:beta-D-glucosyl crocetin beta-1,6-glucosyltransferase-like [Salvia miltiorrhiza]